MSRSQHGAGPGAIKAETIHTVSGAPITNGVILIRDGKIERVGPESQVTIPSGYRTLTAKVATPGLIDAHTVVGLAGYLNQPGDQDQLEASSAIQPELRAIDSYNSREKLVEYLRTFGITTIHTGHTAGALVSGETMIVKTLEGAGDAAVITSEAMIASTRKFRSSRHGSQSRNALKVHRDVEGGVDQGPGIPVKDGHGRRRQEARPKSSIGCIGTRYQARAAAPDYCEPLNRHPRGAQARKGIQHQDRS